MSIIRLSMAALPCCAEEDVEAGSAALRVDWPVYPRRAEHNTVAEGGNWAETARQNAFQSRWPRADQRTPGRRHQRRLTSPRTPGDSGCRPSHAERHSAVIGAEGNLARATDARWLAFPHARLSDGGDGPDARQRGAQGPGGCYFRQRPPPAARRCGGADPARAGSRHGFPRTNQKGGPKLGGFHNPMKPPVRPLA